MAHEIQSIPKAKITKRQLDIIKRTITIGATDEELNLFIFECFRREVHPVDRLIHFVKRQNKATYQCSIDFIRMQAETTGLYRG